MSEAVHHSASPADTMRIARELAKALLPGDVVALDGPLGAGKTQFVRGLAEGLGINCEDVSSPTFVLCQEYASSEARTDGSTAEQPPRRLIHVDAYRMSGPGDLDTIGWDEMLAAEDAVIAVEWPGRIASALPARRIDVSIDYAAAEEARQIVIAQRCAPRTRQRGGENAT